MIEVMIGLLGTVIVAVGSAGLCKINTIEGRMDELEVRLPEKYVTKDDYNATVMRIFSGIERIEAKLDQRILGELERAEERIKDLEERQ